MSRSWKKILWVLCVVVSISRPMEAAAGTEEPPTFAKLASEGRSLLAPYHDSPYIQSLHAGEDTFLIFFRPGLKTTPLATIVVVTDDSSHPKALFVIEPLLEGLPRQGYSALSFDPPYPKPTVAGTQAGSGENRPSSSAPSPYEDYFIRLDAIFHFLSAKNPNQPLVLVGYRKGAIIASEFAQRRKPPQLRGLIYISAIDPNITALHSERLALSIDQSVPVLDVIAGFDQAEILRQAKARLEARKAFQGPKASYQQRIIPEAGGNYIHAEESLVKTLQGWLRREIKKSTVA